MINNINTFFFTYYNTLLKCIPHSAVNTNFVWSVDYPAIVGEMTVILEYWMKSL